MGLLYLEVLYLDNYINVNNHIATLSDDAKDWTLFFVNYMREKHPELEELIYYKMPAYKLGYGKHRNYIAFFTAKNHFSLHSMDFEYINILKNYLSRPGSGKGCVTVNYKNIAERSILIEGIEEIIQRNILKTYKR